MDDTGGALERDDATSSSASAAVAATDQVDIDSDRDQVALVARRRQGTLAWIIVTVVLVALLATAGYGLWRMWDVTQAWEQRAAELTDVNYDLGATLAETQVTVLRLERDNALLSDQLSTSNQRVIELVSEKENVVDANADASQQIASLGETLETADDVAFQLNRCIEGQIQLREYLTAALADPDNHDPDELDEYATSVDTLCDGATSAYLQLAEVLNR